MIVILVVTSIQLKFFNAIALLFQGGMIYLSSTRKYGLWLSPVITGVVFGCILFARIRSQSVHREGKPTWVSFFLLALGVAFLLLIPLVVGVLVFWSQSCFDVLPGALGIGLIASEIFYLWTDR